MKQIPFCLKLFCAFITASLPILAAQTVEVGYPQDPSSTQKLWPCHDDSRSLLDDLSMLEEFDVQNRQANQVLNAKLDEQEDPLLQEALSESQAYAESLITYDNEGPQRLKFMKLRMAESIAVEISGLKHQLSEADAKEDALRRKLVQEMEAKDETWNTTLTAYLAVIDERKELDETLRRKTGLHRLLTSDLNSPIEERGAMPVQYGAAGVLPVSSPGSLPRIHSSALPILSSSSSAFTPNSSDK